MVLKNAVALAALLFGVGLAAAMRDEPDKKKNTKDLPFTTVFGTFESYKDEKLILLVEGKEREFKVPGETQVGYFVEKDKKPKISKAKEHLKDVKKGSIVAVTLDEAKKKVLGLGVTELKEKEKAQEKAKDQ